jgi:hypothetical protein
MKVAILQSALPTRTVLFKAQYQIMCGVTSVPWLRHTRRAHGYCIYWSVNLRVETSAALAPGLLHVQERVLVCVDFQYDNIPDPNEAAIVRCIDGLFRWCSRYVGGFDVNGMARAKGRNIDTRCLR